MNNNNNYNYNNANPLDKSPPGGRKKPTKPKSIKEKGEKISSPKLDPVINLPSFPIITETPIFSLGYNPVDKPFTGNNGVFFHRITYLQVLVIHISFMIHKPRLNKGSDLFLLMLKLLH